MNSDPIGKLFSNKNDYLKLVSAQIVLKVLNESIKKLNDEENNDTNDSSKKKSVDLKSKSKENESDDSMATRNYVKMRKHFNVKRWNCISRPQYKYSCGISSLVSCWNYLYSTLGYGKLKPLSQEDAMNILGFKAPYDEIRFGPFTGNKTLMKWFNSLNQHFNVSGRASFLYKPIEPNRTLGITGKLTKERLRTLLKSKNNAFIYHCYNHYCCPIGFELEPLSKENIFIASSPSHTATTTISPASTTNDDEEFVDWFLLADTSRKYPSFHCVKWDDIDRDLNTKGPEYLNIRNLDKGVQTRKVLSRGEEMSDELSKKQIERNLHCLIRFESFSGEDFTQFEVEFVNNQSNMDIGSNDLDKIEDIVDFNEDDNEY